jgi:hypothetical protein
MNELRKAAERLLEALEDGWVQRDDWVAFELRQALDQTKNQIPTTLCGPNLEQTLNAAGFYRQREWDTSDMAHRSGGLSVEQAKKQEPVGYFDSNVLQVPAIYRGLDGWVTEIYSVPRGNCTFPLYTAPPKREWVGLTDEEIHKIIDDCTPDEAELEELNDFAKAIFAVEAKLKERNGI